MENPDRKAPAYPIGSVDNALILLQLLGEKSQIRVSEASDALEVVRSTAHRLLAMLQYRGFVEQDPDSRAYRAGPTLRDIGLAVVRSMDIRGHMLPYMEKLVAEVEETVQLMVLQGSDALFIAGVDSPQILRTASRVGMTLPAHCTAGGKAILAELAPETVRQLLPARLPKRTPESITSRAKLERELEEIRQRGYALNFGESEPDVGAVGVCLTNTAGSVRAAWAVTAPLSRIDKDLVHEIAEIMIEAGKDAAAGLG